MEAIQKNPTSTKFGPSGAEREAEHLSETDDRAPANFPPNSNETKFPPKSKTLDFPFSLQSNLQVTLTGSLLGQLVMCAVCRTAGFKRGRQACLFQSLTLK
jgi:hypothetical protein